MNRDSDISPSPKDAQAGFHRRDWFDMLARHCFAQSRVLFPMAQTNTTRATLPLVEDGNALSALANYYSFSYAPILEGDGDRATTLSLLARIAADLRASHSRISVYPLVDDGAGMPDLLRAAFARAGWIALLTDQNSNYVADVAGQDFASYWKARPGALRSAVRRKGKGAHYAHFIHREMDDALWADYCAVYAASWKNAEPWPDMVRAIAEDAARRGALRLGITRHEERPVAAQLWTIEGDTACIHKIAHDSGEDTHSPGTLLSHHMFAHMIDVEEVARIDYGTGGNPYKRDWMDRARPMLRLDCFHPRSARWWLPALRTRISQLVGRRG
jgi:hypothetical protein